MSDMDRKLMYARIQVRRAEAIKYLGSNWILAKRVTKKRW